MSGELANIWQFIFNLIFVKKYIYIFTKLFDGLSKEIVKIYLPLLINIIFKLENKL